MALSVSTEAVRTTGVYYLEDILSTRRDLTASPDLNVKAKLVHKLIDAAIIEETGAFIDKNTAERLRLVPGITPERAEELAHVVLREMIRFRKDNQPIYRTATTESSPDA